MWIVDVSSGLLDSATYRASPNCNARPAGVAIDLIVIHGISLPEGEFGGPWIDALFANQIKGTEHPNFASLKGLKVSSHLLIRRDGEILQYVPFTKRAWHAGVSEFKGRANCNDFSIGIELEGADNIAYGAIQYEQLNKTLRALLHAYPAVQNPECIVGHVHIAPGRKTDPWPVFNWSLVRAALATSKN